MDHIIYKYDYNILSQNKISRDIHGTRYIHIYIIITCIVHVKRFHRKPEVDRWKFIRGLSIYVPLKVSFEGQGTVIYMGHQ